MKDAVHINITINSTIVDKFTNLRMKFIFFCEIRP